MIDNFPTFAKIVNQTFKDISNRGEVFVVDFDGDDLYRNYLAAFPEGTNPRFRERTEHDCSCCKNFVRNAGNIVAIDGSGQLLTVWDDAAGRAPYPYNRVAESLREILVNSQIANLCRFSEGGFGSETTRQLTAGAETVTTWHHFYTGPIPTRLFTKSPGEECGNYRTTVQVFKRGMEELSPDAVNAVMELINANALYRGEEHRAAVAAFQAAQQEYLGMNDRQRHVYAWTHVGVGSRFRNTAIGKLVQDVSSGMDLEEAVRLFETMVAPQNYKRTSAIVTPAMVARAMDTIRLMGLEQSLERRFARLDDISVRDVLWADNGVRPMMRGGLEDVLMQHAKDSSPVDPSVVEERASLITMDAFLKTVLPTATGVELLLRNEHLGNMVSLTAPVHPDTGRLFRWGNDFAWSYTGNVADSIKERVKRAGGNVTAQLRISLSWFNHDDLDLHVVEPNRHRIHFASKLGRGGALDVDMNVTPTTRVPVENVAFSKAHDGVYRVEVHNFCQRERIDVGFDIEIENAGKLSHFSRRSEVRHRTFVPVANIRVKDGKIVELAVLDDSLSSKSLPQEKWGLRSEQFVKVNAVTMSPNFWGDSSVGNRHLFFFLDGAKSDEPMRGIYNEFLHPKLEPYRKVFDLIGEKTKCRPTDGQLSGLGFSTTKPAYVVVRVFQGAKKQKLFNINIGGMSPSRENNDEDQRHV